MCRGKLICSELGTDPNRWDKFSPLPTPHWMKGEIDVFVTAVNEILHDKKENCLQILKEIKSDEITQCYIEHVQMSGRHRKNILKISPPPAVSTEERDPIRSPHKIQEQVFQRDGYRCRYCGNKLISQKFIRRFIQKLNDPIFRRGRTNLATHGIIHLTWPVADHVVPWNQGGRTDLDNLVSSCASCNYGKDGNTIQQIGIHNPFDREPIIDTWNGLTDKLNLFSITH